LQMRPFCVLLEPRRMRGNQWENVHANQHAMQILLPCYVIQLQCMWLHLRISIVFTIAFFRYTFYIHLSFYLAIAYFVYTHFIVVKHLVSVPLNSSTFMFC
jgi:hypothetical protein